MDVVEKTGLFNHKRNWVRLEEKKQTVVMTGHLPSALAILCAPQPFSCFCSPVRGAGDKMWHECQQAKYHNCFVAPAFNCEGRQGVFLKQHVQRTLHGRWTPSTGMLVEFNYVGKQTNFGQLNKMRVLLVTW